MKSLKLLLVMIFALAFMASVASAGPYAVTGDFDKTIVTKCVFVLNGQDSILVDPTPIDSTKSYCKYDLANAINGNNVVSVAYKNLWGSSTTVPFEFTKVLPPTPSNIRLSE